eukprot:Hpha_TRINITY_DN15803_c3_g2::TRINITY_DN15803_c3_g2_i1::g.189845::m.189845/K10417/DYNC2LI; dynein light intermediate chain 2, cytosolic
MGEEKEEKKKEEEHPKEEEKLKFDAKQDLWSNIAAQSKHSDEVQETNVLVIGGRGAGKTTLVQRFVKKDDSGAAPRPTTALEYCFGRREEGKKTQIVHFWEIGGGSELHSLLDIVVKPEQIHTIVVVIVCDLGDPYTLWETMHSSVAKVWHHVTEVFSKMRAKSKTPDKLVERHKKKILQNMQASGLWEGKEAEMNHEVDQMRLCGLPILFVGSQYDRFQENPMVQLVAKTMRYMAHLYGAHLLWTTSKDERELKKWHSLLSQLVFGSNFPPKYLNKDYADGPLFIFSGRDSFESIGPPDALKRNPEGWQSSADEELDKWRKPFCSEFPPRASVKGGGGGDDVSFDTMLAQDYAEPEIDAMRRQKDQELETQRKEARKERAKGAHG